MYILPLSLFLATTYLRPRTQAELSYLITAIECLSGIWCLLFAPFVVQISLMSLFFLRNTKEISSLLSGFTTQSNTVDLAHAEGTTIDIIAHPIPHTYLDSVIKEEGSSRIQPHYLTAALPVAARVESPISTLDKALAPITLYHPQTETHQSLDAIAPVSKPSDLAATPQIVQMQYRGVTYFKRV